MPDRSYPDHEITETVTLPARTTDVDAINDRHEDSNVPSWELTSFAFRGSCVTAWDNGVEIDGDMIDSDDVPRLEGDVLAVLAAIRAHKVFAAVADGVVL